MYKCMVLSYVEGKGKIQMKPGRPEFNPKSSHTKDAKNGT